ncbi:dockerin type I repeat-containing protein [Algisphaera agarilytica]|uniref:Uncharacterized protein n=1 Tax=Algisphaera agarilytica TaxID=1385975 RepID=A0A7X0LJC4_9BACT|nr:dockerin type I repeat-containing protein [Algisphaera agarilytica]MBB6429180.1 hypothetical protein [Algisphaera agarilytica]
MFESRSMVCGLLACGVSVSAMGQSQWVSQGQTGLLYQMDSRGDRVLDYSAAGYMGGVALPDPLSLVDASRIVDLTPISGDNLAQIRAAIQQVSGMSQQANGYRGIVRFAPGQYDISNSLRIESSGVVLLGAGDGANPASNTILRSTSTNDIDIIDVGDRDASNDISRVGSPINILDKVVPAGATSLRVADASGFSAGDWVNVKHTPTQAWFDAVGVNDPEWNTSNDRFTTQHERRITRVEGDRVFFHAPISHSIDSRLAQGTVEFYSDDRVDHVGIANIRGTSVYNAAETGTASGRPIFTDEDHARTFIAFNHAEESWATGVTGQHLISSAVSVGVVSRSITVEDATYIDPVSQVTGGRRYAFNTQGGLVLMKDLEADSARRAFINNSTFNGFNRGPNVFLDGEGTNSFVRSGPHAGYSTGALYDNISDDGGFEARKASSPSVHGWRGAHTVVWNSAASEFQIANPPFARNFLIGSEGALSSSTTASGATLDSHGQRIAFNDPDNPLDSLYVQQLLEQQRNPNIEKREYWLGDFDQFEVDGPGSADDLYVDADWRTQVENITGWRSGMPLVGTDDEGINRLIPFSFQYELAPDEEVVSAVLTLATRRLGSHSDNDTLFLDGLTESHQLLFGSQEAWGMMFDDDIQVVSIELLGDIDFMQDGLFNVLVSDDRPVDWAHLQLSVATITDILLGDYNGNGIVDAADYTVWQDSFGSTTDLAADGNGNGVIDAADFTIWQDNFGNTQAAPTSNIPEPTSAATIIAVFALAGYRQR